ncbi:xylose isomerase domain-containing protein [Novosphingobium sp. Rr 2-17]|uniref:TIM barrel protein n=1 Tax=Novosphingobium sp. Rr 2-17 TaxID=555793 RepID=UPI000269A86D|nr:TIM barrel protein [Novosphingobium sp. Rr 2-17]EIZ77905.1 xylose isomerase domain-containing protein [Novosphingobium sp. Rr 2-17]
MNAIASFDPSKTWLGITPTLWWNDDFPLLDAGVTFEHCISEMALAGFRGCSIGHKYPTDPAVLKAALDLRGLRISEPWVSTYFTIEAMTEKTIKEAHAQLDFLDAVEAGSEDPRRADLVVAEFGGAINPLPVALFPNAPHFSDKQWDLLIAGLNRIGRIAHERGRNLCYHPHLGTGVMHPYAIERLFDNTDPLYVHMLLDTAHITAGGSDALAVTKKYAKRVKHVHLKDVRLAALEKVKKDGLSFEEGVIEGIFTVPGDGGITTLPDILQVLSEAGFTGWLMTEAEQVPKGDEPLMYAKMARAFFLEHLGW